MLFDEGRRGKASGSSRSSRPPKSPARKGLSLTPDQQSTFKYEMRRKMNDCDKEEGLTNFIDRHNAGVEGFLSQVDFRSMLRGLEAGVQKSEVSYLFRLLCPTNENEIPYDAVLVRR